MAEEITDLSGTIERVIYKNSENHYAVISLAVSSGQSVTVKGIMQDPHQGTVLHCKGSWVYHKKFGAQFDARECSVELPHSAAGIQKYLSSGLVKGIGPKFAERLVSHFGAQTLDIIDKEPQRLQEVHGVGPTRISAIIKAWQDQKEIAAVMVFLRAKDVSASFALKIFKQYGSQSIPLMQENPYRLVDDIWGIGFKTADQIALKLGLAKDSLQRTKAALLFVLAETTNNGHLYAELEILKQRVAEFLELEAVLSAQRIKESLTDLYHHKKIILIKDEQKFFVTLPQYYYSEKGIAFKIKLLLGQKPTLSDINLQDVYAALRVPDKRGIMMNEEQQHGIMSCFSHNVAIITGGPGTGKTTMIKRLLDLYEEHHVKVKLAAPTGRAAKRIFESTGRTAETLHRLLEFSPVLMQFSRNEQNALDCQVLVIDEASMIDAFLMHAVIKALPNNAALILIGDINQLPSVGAGNILHDLIASEQIPTIKLQQIFRQAQNSLIIINAHRVNNGQFPVSQLPESKRDYIFIPEENPEQLFQILRTLYQKKLPEKQIQPEESMILAPMNRGIAGAQRLNQEMQLILNPQQPEALTVSHFGRQFKKADPVMQLRNNYDKFVFNGDIGIVTHISQEDRLVLIDFNSRQVEYDFSELNELVLAYATSIHKSQGSEFKAVIIPIFMQHFMLLQRNLIYTALTRAKNLCIVIGQPKALAMGIKNDKAIERTTFLQKMLTDGLTVR